MEVVKNKTVGYAVAALGAIIAVVGGLADTLGIGAEGAEGMGGKQLGLLLVGLVVVAAGLAIVFLSGQEDEGGETATSTDAADTTSDTTSAEAESEAGTETDAADTAIAEEADDDSDAGSESAETADATE